MANARVVPVPFVDPASGVPRGADDGASPEVLPQSDAGVAQHPQPGLESLTPYAHPFVLAEKKGRVGIGLMRYGRGEVDPVPFHLVHVDEQAVGTRKVPPLPVPLGMPRSSHEREIPLQHVRDELADPVFLDEEEIRIEHENEPRRDPLHRLVQPGPVMVTSPALFLNGNGQAGANLEAAIGGIQPIVRVCRGILQDDPLFDVRCRIEPTCQLVVDLEDVLAVVGHRANGERLHARRGARVDVPLRVCDFV